MQQITDRLTKRSRACTLSVGSASSAGSDKSQTSNCTRTRLRLDIDEQVINTNIGLRTIKLLNLGVTTPSKSLPQSAMALDLSMDVPLQIDIPCDSVPYGASWDDINTASEPACGPQPVQFQHQLLSTVLMNAANVFLGFGSDIVEWDSGLMRFIAPLEVRETPLGSFLDHCCAHGSYFRRLLRAADELQACPTISHPIDSLAIAVRNEVRNIQKEGNCLFTVSTVLEFCTECFSISNAVQLLAQLLGCFNLQGAGFIKRVPNSMELLNRVYNMAKTTGADMLWRLVVACLQPWLEQVNFAIGSRDLHVARSPSIDAKQLWFPDLFIDVRNDSPVIIEELVPQFVPDLVAIAVLECYNLLAILDMEQYNYAETITKNVGTAKLNIGRNNIERFAVKGLSDLCVHSNDRDAEQRFISNAINQNVATPPTTATITSPKEIRSILTPILHRANTLDRVVRQVLAQDLGNFREVVTGAYLMNDGELWFSVCDLIDQSRSDELSSHQLARDLQEAVSSRYPSLVVERNVTDSDTFTTLLTPSPVISAIFGPHFIRTCQSVMAQLLLMQMHQKFFELAILTSKITEVVEAINATFKCETAGLRDIVSALHQVLKLA